MKSLLQNTYQKFKQWLQLANAVIYDHLLLRYFAGKSNRAITYYGSLTN